MENKVKLIASVLHHSLVIDDNDSSIKYHTTDIKSETSAPIVDSLEELNELYQNHEDIFIYDTTNCVTLITENGIEVPLYRYTDNMHIRLIKISSEELRKNDNDIIISTEMNHLASDTQLTWQPGSYSEKLYDSKLNYTEFGHMPIAHHKFFSNAIQNKFDGYDLTQEILKYAKSQRQAIYNSNYYQEMINAPDYSKYKTIYDTVFNKASFPAAEYCDKEIEFGSSIYHGYLPASGQLEIVFCKFNNLINYILKSINKDPLYRNTYWSSSEVEQNKNCVYIKHYNKGSISYDYKTSICTVIPFFKKMN